MSTHNYPMDIYPKPTDLMNESVERAYSIGFNNGAKSVPELPSTFYNLTKAIQDGANIDYDLLDGRAAKCVHEEIGILSHGLWRNPKVSERVAEGWIKNDCSVTDVWAYAIKRAWTGITGWSLWVEGEVPTKLQTAETLDPATGFYGCYGSTLSRCFVYLNREGKKRVYDVRFHRVHKPEHVEVIQVYGIGTLQATKGEA